MPRGHKFKVTAKGGERGRRFVEWPLLRLYGGALIITLAAIAYAFILHLRGEDIAYGGLALAWSFYNAFILLIVSLICIEQPRKRKAERFVRNEAILLRQSGKSHLARLADISITGARLIDPMPPAIGGPIECRIYGRAISAVVVRHTVAGFAVRFADSMDTRVHAVRAFYAGEYVRAYRGISAFPVGKALLLRLFGQIMMILGWIGLAGWLDSPLP